MPISTKKITTDFSIGAIVSLSSHPYFKESDNDFAFIGGDHEIVPPLMVITETLKENKAVFEESTGMEIVKQGSFQCKCLWYSKKTGLFEDAWISSRLLKVIVSDIKSLDFTKLSYGSLATFNTVKVELGKKKVSYKQTGQYFDDKSRNITALLSFSSPVLHVIGTARNESKDPLRDPKTGDIKRVISEHLVKCKYYNPVSEKFSEVLLPIKSIELLQNVSNEVLDSIEQAIKDNALLKTPSRNVDFNETIIKPIRVNYKSGCYYLEGEDYLENSIVEILITGTADQFEILDTKLQHLPKIEEKGKSLLFKAINKTNLSKLKRNVYWKIKYKDFNDKTTIRTIYNPTFFLLGEVDEDDNERVVDYLKANCILRNQEERYFRIDRIQKLEVIDLEVGKNTKK